MDLMPGIFAVGNDVDNRFGLRIFVQGGNLLCGDRANDNSTNENCSYRSELDESAVKKSHVEPPVKNPSSVSN